jgi:hypothetical protein
MKIVLKRGHRLAQRSFCNWCHEPEGYFQVSQQGDWIANLVDENKGAERTAVWNA